MATSTHPITNRNAAASGPSAPEVLEGIADATAGVGLLFASFLGAIPGLLPFVALTILALVILAIPMLVLGIAIGVVFAVGVLIKRIASRAVAIATRSRRAQHRLERGVRETGRRAGASLHEARPTV
jgi:hypothetical protein